MKHKKALFFDIDGTLISEITRTVPKSTVAALNQARMNGHKVFINTGRVICSIPKELEGIPFDGLLCGCGTYIYYEGQVIHKKSIQSEQCRKIVELVKDCKVGAVLESWEDVYFPEYNQAYHFVEHIKESFRPLGLGRNAGFDTENLVFDKLMVEVSAESRADSFFYAIAQDMDVIDRGDGLYECIQKGYSKATAIDVILARLNLDLADAYVFGDSSNDLSMFCHVPNAIAMGKHSESLEPYTTFITKTVEDDGIRYALESLGII